MEDRKKVRLTIGYLFTQLVQIAIQVSCSAHVHGSSSVTDF